MVAQQMVRIKFWVGKTRSTRRAAQCGQCRLQCGQQCGSPSSPNAAALGVGKEADYHSLDLAIPVAQAGTYLFPLHPPRHALDFPRQGGIGSKVRLPHAQHIIGSQRDIDHTVNRMKTQCAPNQSIHCASPTSHQHEWNSRWPLARSTRC
jgi:hypothetical protein